MLNPHFKMVLWRRISSQLSVFCRFTVTQRRGGVCCRALMMCGDQMKCRRQLRVSGVPFIVYWAAQFIVDIVELVAITTLAVLIFVAFQVRFGLFSLSAVCVHDAFCALALFD